MCGVEGVHAKVSLRGNGKSDLETLRSKVCIGQKDFELITRNFQM